MCRSPLLRRRLGGRRRPCVLRRSDRHSSGSLLQVVHAARLAPQLARHPHTTPTPTCDGTVANLRLAHPPRRQARTAADLPPPIRSWTRMYTAAFPVTVSNTLCRKSLNPRLEESGPASEAALRHSKTPVFGRQWEDASALASLSQKITGMRTRRCPLTPGR